MKADDADDKRFEDRLSPSDDRGDENDNNDDDGVVDTNEGDDDDGRDDNDDDEDDDDDDDDDDEDDDDDRCLRLPLSDFSFLLSFTSFDSFTPFFFCLLLFLH